MADTVNAARRLLTRKLVKPVVDHLVHGRLEPLWGTRRPTAAFRHAADALCAAGLVRGGDSSNCYPENIRFTARGRDLYFGRRSRGWVLSDWGLVMTTPGRAATYRYRSAAITHEGWDTVPLTPTAVRWVDWCRRAYGHRPHLVERALTCVTGMSPDMLPHDLNVGAHARTIAEFLPASLRIGQRRGLARDWQVVCVPIITADAVTVVVVRGDTAVVTELDLVLYHRRAVTTLLDVADL